MRRQTALLRRSLLSRSMTRCETPRDAGQLGTHIQSDACHCLCQRLEIISAGTTRLPSERQFTPLAFAPGTPSCPDFSSYPHLRPALLTTCRAPCSPPHPSHSTFIVLHILFKHVSELGKHSRWTQGRRRSWTKTRRMLVAGSCWIRFSLMLTDVQEVVAAEHAQ